MRSERGSLPRRLILGQTLLVMGMALSIVLAAVLIGPTVFDDHMRRAGHGDQPDVLDHAQEAFFSAGLQSIGVGLVVAAAGALVVTTVTTRGLGRWLDALSRGAARVSAGHYEQPVVLFDASPELERVADAFNGMAAQIETTELRRRSLLTDVAHELRTPIAAINVTVEALEDGVVAAGEGAYATLRAQTARLTRLSSDIRDVSAAEEGRLPIVPMEISVRELVEVSVLQWVQRFDEEGVELAYEVRADACVDVDRARMVQVLDNVLTNALRHTPDGGRVGVDVHVADGRVHVDVIDNGEGIDTGALPHVMERFYRGDPSRSSSDGSGTGVGLAIARAIVRAHGGELRVQSLGLGHGTTVTVLLPSSPNLHRS